MKSRHPRFVLISLTSAALCGVLATAPASAADSACKGLAQAQCEAMADCGWTSEYTRKDGKTVAGYCKKANTKGAGATKDEAASPTPVVKAPAPPPAVKAPAPLPAVKATAPAPAGTATGPTPPPK